MRSIWPNKPMLRLSLCESSNSRSWISSSRRRRNLPTPIRLSYSAYKLNTNKACIRPPIMVLPHLLLIFQHLYHFFLFHLLSHLLLFHPPVFIHPQLSMMFNFQLQIKQCFFLSCMQSLTPYMQYICEIYVTCYPPTFIFPMLQRVLRMSFYYANSLGFA